MKEEVDRLRGCVGALKHAQDLALYMDPLEKEDRDRIGEVCDDTVVAIRLFLRKWSECAVIELQNSSTQDKAEKS
jgi:hypothetical protein